MLYPPPVDDHGAAHPQATPAKPTGRVVVRRVLLLAIGLLYVFSVPWYRSTGDPVAVWWGLPDWVAVAVGCYAAVAVLNALAWLLTEVPDHERDGGAS